MGTLTIGFPFLTVGLALGVLSAPAAWGSLLTFDPLALFSLVMWVIYAATLLGRVLGQWGAGAPPTSRSRGSACCSPR